MVKNLEFDFGKNPRKPARRFAPKEYKVVSLRECPTPASLQFCTTPEQAVEYWRLHVVTAPYFKPDCECFVTLLLNTRRRVKGHELIGIGILDSVLTHAREVFRAAIVSAASAVVLMHNHPAGDPSPSEADIRVTRELIQAGKLLRIEVLDHVIVGEGIYASLRELGYFSF